MEQIAKCDACDKIIDTNGEDFTLIIPNTDWCELLGVLAADDDAIRRKYYDLILDKANNILCNDCADFLSSVMENVKERIEDMKKLLEDNKEEALAQPCSDEIGKSRL